ncbi:hypothetical protein QCE63_35335 [Caballeronia sp. LZ065]|uniref:hypothetical protein n=1 Tax=Caballeronia sp. LZ065 TaxID=3038571 RepID=UPI00285E2A81|nr:hypothetical protein [Caballeronia sp. LZ065]MDR5784665.1 hypothetical protein [Caballeronia sp. LZ065]
MIDEKALQPDTLRMKHVRREARLRADQEDAVLWRWFSGLFEEGRLRWCRAAGGWLVSVDHRHVATHKDFDAAIRTAFVTLHPSR